MVMIVINYEACEIWGSYGSVYEYYCILECHVMYSSSYLPNILEETIVS